MFDPLEDELQTLAELDDTLCKRTRCGKLPKAIRLHDPIETITRTDFCVFPENTNLKSVVCCMQTKHLGCVLLEKEGRLSGIFTERDLLIKVVGQGVDYDLTPVREFMTPDSESLRNEDAIAYALNKMLDGGFRNIPLVDRDNRPVGVVNMASVVQYIGEYFYNEVMNLPPIPLRRQHAREGG